MLHQLALELGFDQQQFAKEISSPLTKKRVEKDITRAKEIGFRSISTLVINDAYVISETMPLEKMCHTFQQISTETSAA